MRLLPEGFAGGNHTRAARARDREVCDAASVERVEGIGGFFFKAEDPEALTAWYSEHLGIVPVPTSYDGPVWTQLEGETVFAPFPAGEDSPYLGPTGWGINFRVRDLDAIVAQLRGAGIDVAIDAEEYPNGRFAQLQDPEGNAIQLWQPA
jgi:predicted enzyme related to lactoylglutathione lyase